MLNQYRTCKIELTVKFANGEQAIYQRATENWRVFHGEFEVDSKQFMSIKNADDLIEKFESGKLFQIMFF